MTIKSACNGKSVAPRLEFYVNNDRSPKIKSVIAELTVQGKKTSTNIPIFVLYELEYSLSPDRKKGFCLQIEFEGEDGGYFAVLEKNRERKECEVSMHSERGYFATLEDIEFSWKELSKAVSKFLRDFEKSQADLK